MIAHPVFRYRCFCLVFRVLISTFIHYDPDRTSRTAYGVRPPVSNLASIGRRTRLAELIRKDGPHLPYQIAETHATNRISNSGIYNTFPLSHPNPNDFLFPSFYDFEVQKTS